MRTIHHHASTVFEGSKQPRGGVKNLWALLLATLLVFPCDSALAAAAAAGGKKKPQSTVAIKKKTVSKKSVAPASKVAATANSKSIPKTRSKAAMKAAPKAPSATRANAAVKPVVKVAPKAVGKTVALRNNNKKKQNYAVKSTMTMDVTRRRVIYEQSPDKAIAPASLTKVLSMYVILDQVRARKVSLDAFVPVSAKAAGTGGSQMGISFGEKLRLRDLLKGMAVASGNDATVAAAQYVGGSEAAFVRLMNQKAKQIGMRQSIFKNVHGLPASGQQTTARDMMTLATRYIKDHPDALQQFHAQRYLDYHGYTPNTNPLLGVEGVDGLKTGFVCASGFNLITTARRGNTRLVNVLLGAPNKTVRMQEAAKLVETGFQVADAMAAKDAEKNVKRGAPKRKGKNTAAAVADSSPRRVGSKS